MKTKSVLSKIVLYLSISAFLAPVSVTLARVPKNQLGYGSVTIQALGVSEPAILASNPFYGLTDLVRGMKDSFASGALEKAVVRLANLNLKAAQLLKIRLIAPDNTKSNNKALNEYQLAVYQYGITAARLTPADFVTEEGADAVPEFIDSSLLNLRLIDDLFASSQTTFDQALLAEIFDRFEQSTVTIFVDDIGIETVRLHILDAKGTDSLVGIRNAEMLASLAKQATALGRTQVAQELMAIRVVLLDTIASALRSSAVATTEEGSTSVVTAAKNEPSLRMLAPAAAVPTRALSAAQVSEIGLLVGSPAERIQTLSYLLSTPAFENDADLINLRNQLLIKVFSK